ncbi:nuclease-related domain-containing protein [Nocardioides sp. Root151]|uniref:nuclease-related domain-containing protein n=1 Tax=Nocardioides sp. Root151 TaxID=1736475 RepID=UPI0007034221|nr:nuclease-related domain-containing protein [Nocardioides sp. Root151]KQZ67111.1 hypothetical protein ASD66_19155 [Nocardioides sp. Root151]
MAGESARDQARQQHEKAARHKQTAERYERGADGELATAEVLEPLEAQGWVVRHDVAWPGRPRANIDHVAIGPGGVYVIDSKNWSGDVVVRDRGLRQKGRSRESTVEAAAEAARAVSEALGGVPVTDVLCFTGDAALEGWVDDVLVCSTGNVAELLTTRPPTLHDEAVERFVRRAIIALPATTEPRGTLPKSVADALEGTPTRRVVLRRSSTRRLRTALVGGAITLGFIGAMAFVAPRIAPTLMDVFTSGMESAEVKVGESVDLEGAGSRPDLSLTVKSVDDVAKAGGKKPAKGERLVAVRLRIENTGSTRWVAGRGPDISVETTDGRTYDAAPRFSTNPGGEVFQECHA